jgi:hypothetical protein
MLMELAIMPLRERSKQVTITQSPLLFERYHANVHFGTGKKLELTLYEETVEDP